jgi:hypothetical protein
MPAKIKIKNPCQHGQAGETITASEAARRGIGWEHLLEYARARPTIYTVIEDPAPAEKPSPKKTTPKTVPKTAPKKTPAAPAPDNH